MYELPKNQMSGAELAILRKLRVWIVALIVTCVATGIGIGAILVGRPAVAQSEMGIAAARAPEALSASFAQIAERVEPAVVNIETSMAAPDTADRDDEEKDGSPSNPLLDMFRQRARRPPRGVGSGFIVDPKGFILTNWHVVQGATRITVSLQSGQKFIGRVIGMDEATDVAVVKIDAPKDLPTAKLGDSSTVQVGDWVLAIGSPFGLDQTVTAGIISKKERESEHFSAFQRFLQTDAAINRGNSGGPLVNMRGEVIGINSQIATSTGDYNGIGFALPTDEAAFVYQQLISQGKVRRGFLGINLESVKAEYARVYNLPDARGVIVTDVTKADGPAGKAGIQAMDIIVEFNGQQVGNARDLISRVAATEVGRTAPVTYLREMGGKFERRTVNVTLGERPASLAQLGEETQTAPKNEGKSPAAGIRLGITLGEITPQIAAERNLAGVRGLIITDVDPNGIIADAVRTDPVPTREGHVIQRINRVPVATRAEFQRVVDNLKPGDPVVLIVARRDRAQDRVVQQVVQFTYQ